MHLLRWALGIIMVAIAALAIIGILPSALNENDKKKGNNAWGGIVICIIIACVGWFGVIPHGRATTTSATAHVKAGDSAIINTSDDFTAATKDYSDQLSNYVSAGNMDAIHNMISLGELAQLPKGTHVDVLDISFSGLAHVNIKDGPWEGKEGYLPYEQLTVVKS